MSDDTNDEAHLKELADRRQAQQPVETDRRQGERRVEDAPVLRERRFAERVKDRHLPSTQDILAQADREELIPIELVARATTSSTRKVLRDWRKRKLPLTRIGRSVLLPSRLMLKTYFPNRFPASSDH